ncbi:hypothetical protein C8R46DRAFT_1225071 [Mycena filopes]|nr:hypothetical protein C8R46DRAFT_1225071 [Mycena filopes]
MATSVPTPPEIFGTNLKSMNKAPLQNICIAMGFEDIKSSGKTKDGLISLIESTLDNFPVNLSDYHRFTNLLQARKKVARLQASERAKTSGRKNSAGKAAEDLADASIPLKGITGANLKLFEQKATLDPPASFGPLGLQGQDGSAIQKKKSTKAKTPSSSSPLRSVTPSYHGSQIEVPELPENHDDEEEEPFIEEKPPAPSITTVVVRLLHPTDKDQPTQQVIVNDVKIIETKASDGSVKHQAELTHLLPKAINNSSLIKGDPRGRFSRPGVGAGREDDRLSVGTVAQHLDGTASTHANLSFKAGNRIPLDPQEDVYECELYFQPGLALAKHPEPFEKVQLTYTGVAYDSHISMTAYLKSFKPFYKGGQGGYHIPADYIAPDWVTVPYDSLVNGDFTQLEAMLSTGRRSTTSRTNKSLFDRALTLPAKSEIGKWLRAARPTPLGEDEDLALVDNDDVSPFEYMKTSEFKELVDDALKDLADQKPSLNKAGASSSRSVSKKRARKDRDGNEVDGEGSSKKRKRNNGDEKKKSKRQREKRKEKGGTSSDHLDSSDSSDDD